LFTIVFPNAHNFNSALREAAVSIKFLTIADNESRAAATHAHQSYCVMK
jgi:hypothetical protein